MSLYADDEGKPKAKKSSANPKPPKPPTEPTTLDDGWTAFPPFLLFKENINAQGNKKVAAFDLDGTLILRRSESQWGPVDSNDWRWFNDSVREKLAELCADGYQIVIFSNQGTIKKALIGKASEKIRGLVDNVLKSLSEKHVHAQVLLATAPPDQGDKFRKPGSGMWDFFVENLNKSVSPNLNDCFYVGDAAGRETDINNGASSDKDFAAALGIAFHLPEDYFGCAQASHSYGELKLKYNSCCFWLIGIHTFEISPLTRPLTIQLSCRPATKSEQTSALQVQVASNAGLAGAFHELASLLKEKADNFKASAFFKVANVIAQHPTEITKSADLKGIKGVGKSSMAKVDEFMQSGKLAAIEELKNESSAQATVVGKDAEAAFKFL